MRHSAARSASTSPRCASGAVRSADLRRHRNDSNGGCPAYLGRSNVERAWASPSHSLHFRSTDASTDSLRQLHSI
jgi:hypothetical protein